MSSRVKWCLELITANHLQTFPTITAKRTFAAVPLTCSQGEANAAGQWITILSLLLHLVLGSLGVRESYTKQRLHHKEAGIAPP